MPIATAVPPTAKPIPPTTAATPAPAATAPKAVASPSSIAFLAPTEAIYLSLRNKIYNDIINFHQQRKKPISSNPPASL